MTKLRFKDPFAGTFRMLLRGPQTVDKTLPKPSGKGMYGMPLSKDALAAKEREYLQQKLSKIRDSRKKPKKVLREQFEPGIYGDFLWIVKDWTVSGKRRAIVGIIRETVGTSRARGYRVEGARGIIEGYLKLITDGTITYNDWATMKNTQFASNSIYRLCNQFHEELGAAVAAYQDEYGPLWRLGQEDKSIREMQAGRRKKYAITEDGAIIEVSVDAAEEVDDA